MKNAKKKMQYFVVLLFFTTACIFSGCKKEYLKKDGTKSGIKETPHPKPKEGPGTNSPATPSSNAGNLQIFPIDNPWNQDISQSQVDPYSSRIMSRLGEYFVRPDFGSGLYKGKPMGIPYTVVSGTQQKCSIKFRPNRHEEVYESESDPGPYPIPLNAAIEGNGDMDSDGHVIVVDKDNRKLYELANASMRNGQWEAAGVAIFDLTSNKMRPEGWTSAEAAGLPIFPGLVKYEEIAKGAINHPIRFTLRGSHIQRNTYIYPARHTVKPARGEKGASLPFGARIRLKKNFDISGFSPTNQIILNAMKKYGLILADIGMNFAITGSPDPRWDDEDLNKLRRVPASEFEVVKFNN